MTDLIYAKNWTTEKIQHLTLQLNCFFKRGRLEQNTKVLLLKTIGQIRLNKSICRPNNYKKRSETQKNSLYIEQKYQNPVHKID